MTILQEIKYLKKAIENSRIKELYMIKEELDEELSEIYRDKGFRKYNLTRRDCYDFINSKKEDRILHAYTQPR